MKLLSLVSFAFALLAFSQNVIAQTVPLPPTQMADRFGIYNWGVDYSLYPGGGLDRLNGGGRERC